MAKISNTNSYPNQDPVNGDDYVIGTHGSSSPTPLQTKTFKFDDIAEFIGNSSYVGGIQIPTPQMWVYKSANSNPYQADGANPPLKQRALCISVPTQIDKRWLDNNPRLFLFRYRSSNTSSGNPPPKRGNYVHPTHLNGQYIQTNFPGSNWCSSPQNYIDDQGNPSELFPITTEWDFNGDLKYVQKNQSPPLAPGTPITDFKTVNSTAYVEVPINPLQFLFDKGDPLTPFTSLPVTINVDLGFRCLLRSGSYRTAFNTNTPWTDGGDSRKAYFKFAIGIPNPTWTNRNKQTPYIMGDLSDAITFVYQTNGFLDEIQAYQIAQGHSSMISRSLS
jgi:hypothetical protein